MWMRWGLHAITTWHTCCSKVTESSNRGKRHPLLTEYGHPHLVIKVACLCMMFISCPSTGWRSVASRYKRLDFFAVFASEVLPWNTGITSQHFAGVLALNSCVICVFKRQGYFEATLLCLVNLRRLILIPISRYYGGVVSWKSPAIDAKGET